MFFKKQYEVRVGKAEMIMSELLSNAFRSVHHQVKVPPLCKYLNTSTKNARCRLNLYAMNIGILDYFLISNLQENARQYVGALHKNLVETICSVDPQVIENIEDLILDKELISKLIERSIYDEKYMVLSKKKLLNSYISNRIKEYHYAIELKIKLLSKIDLNTTKPFLMDYPVTKVFMQDFLETDRISNREFSIEFSHNISMRSLKLFSKEIDKLFA